MPRKSLFSADDPIEYHANQPIGDLDASYKNGQTAPKTGPVKHVPVRDASGSFTNEEPVHSYMVPSKYLTPASNANMAPKRPLGAARHEPKQPATVPMYSQVATFGSMNRVRRPRVAIPVEASKQRPWTDNVRHYVKLAAALIVAAALFSLDKIKEFWSLVKHQSRRLWMALPLAHARTSYSAYRGARIKRMGMDNTRFKVITPVAVILLLVGIGLFSSFAGEKFLHPGKGGDNANDGTQQGSAVLNVTPGKGGGSSANNSAQGGNASGDNPQTATPSAQSPNGAASAVQSSPASGLGSGGAAPTGGFGGGSTAPVSGGGVSVPTIPAPSTSGSGGTGGGTPVTTPPPPSSGSSGGVTVPLPVNTNVPVNTTVTVPSTTVQDGSGKTIVGTSPISVTGN